VTGNTFERLRCSQREAYWVLHARVLLGETLSEAERIDFVTVAPIVRGACPLCIDFVGGDVT
jgi:hypothetical protein